MAGITRSGVVRALVLAATLVIVATGCDYVSRVTVTSTGAQAAGTSGVNAISATGRYSLIRSFSELAPGGHGDGFLDYYRHDNRTGALVRVTLRGDGSPFPATASARALGMSADGSSVVILVREKLDPADTVTKPALYVRNISAGTTTLASLAPDGSRISVSDVGAAALSTDGQRVAFSAGTYP